MNITNPTNPPMYFLRYSIHTHSCLFFSHLFNLDTMPHLTVPSIVRIPALYDIYIYIVDDFTLTPEGLLATELYTGVHIYKRARRLEEA